MSVCNNSRDVDKLLNTGGEMDNQSFVLFTSNLDGGRGCIMKASCEGIAAESTLPKKIRPGHVAQPEIIIQKTRLKVFLRPFSCFPHHTLVLAVGSVTS